jgi:hypothetical protein
MHLANRHLRRPMTHFSSNQTILQEVDMIALTINYSAFFYRTLAAFAIGTPMLLTVAVSQLPEGTERGEFMVYGLGAVLAVLVTALALRTAYTLGFNKAIGLLNPERNRAVAA